MPGDLKRAELTNTVHASTFLLSCRLAAAPTITSTMAFGPWAGDARVIW
jgi:hypothetical protein